MSDDSPAQGSASESDAKLFDELHRQFTARSEGTLSAEEEIEFEKLICENEQAGELFAKYLLQTASLHAWAWGLKEAMRDDVTPGAATGNRSRWVRTLDPREHPFWFGLTSLAITLLAWLSVFTMISPTQRSPNNRQHARAAIVAELSQARDAVWAVGQKATAEGSPIVAGQPMVLTSGLAEITFVSGARVMLEGPCAFVVEDRSSGTLKVGKLTARADAKQVKGFFISTPASTILDLGTEFGVNVESDGASEVVVFEGKVRVTNLRRELLAEVAQGEQLFVSPAGNVAPQRPAANFVRVLPPGKNTSQGVFVAYQVIRGARGNQNFGGALGHDFVVNRPIEIVSLGVFDDGADGLKQKLTAELWERDDAGTPENFADDVGRRLVVSKVFESESPGSLAGSNRFKHLAEPLRLAPGNYTIVAHGYGANELLANQGGAQDAFKRLNSGDGAISFVGTSRYGATAGEFPTTADRANNHSQYFAGTFSFREPGPTVAPILNPKPAPK